MAKRLFVGNLPYSVTVAQIEELFAKAGKVDSANLITDKYSGRSKGFAFVEMSTEKEAQEAVKTLNNAEMDGRKIVVNEARPQEDRRDASGGGPRRDFSRGPRKQW